MLRLLALSPRPLSFAVAIIMNKLRKKFLITILLTILLMTGFVYLQMMGHISLKPTPDFLIEGTGVINSKWHGFGWKDSFYLVRMNISNGQLNAILKKYALQKTWICDEAVLNSFLGDTPYWWTMNWSNMLIVANRT